LTELAGIDGQKLPHGGPLFERKVAMTQRRKGKSKKLERFRRAFDDLSRVDQSSRRKQKCFAPLRQARNPQLPGGARVRRASTGPYIPYHRPHTIEHKSVMSTEICSHTKIVVKPFILGTCVYFRTILFSEDAASQETGWEEWDVWDA